MIKQPELGKKITELRKAKGWTQEELVERCNVSVRTIQRIETGEVIPRSYTVRIILSALEYDASQMMDEDSLTNEHLKQDSSSTLKPPKSFVPSKDHADTFTPRQLNVAWIAGLVYFILSFVEAPAEYVRFSTGDLLYSEPFYIVLKVVLLLAVVLFYHGLTLVGSMYNNYLLKIVPIILIGLHALLITYDISSIFYDSLEREMVMVMAAIVFGLTGIIYSFSLWRLQPSVGPVAQLAAGFEALSGCLLLTVALALLGDILHVPAELFQIIILYKAAEVVRKKQQNTTLNGELQPSL